MSKHHDAIKNTAAWKAARLACLERDGHACVECGGVERLEVDHIIELATAPELGTEVDNLRTLCRPCHEERTITGHIGIIERHQWINPKYIDALGPVL